MLLAQITISGIQFDFYYFPRTRLLQVDGSGLGTLETPVMPMITYPIELTASSFTINGVAVSFSSNQPDFSPSSYLASTTFKFPLAELILSDAYATTYSSYVASLTELLLESCRVSSGASCTECEYGFQEVGGSCSKYI